MRPDGLIAPSLPVCFKLMDAFLRINLISNSILLKIWVLEIVLTRPQEAYRPRITIPRMGGPTVVRGHITLPAVSGESLTSVGGCRALESIAF